MNKSIYQNLLIIIQYLAQKKRGEISIIFLLSIVGSFLELATISIALPFFSVLLDQSYIVENNLLSKFYLDNFTDNFNKENILLFFVIIFSVVITVSTFFRAFVIYLTTQFCNKLSFNISESLFQTYMSKPLIFHINKNSNILMNSVTRQSSDISQIMNHLILATSSLMTLFFIFFFIFFYNPLITSMAIIVIFSIYYFIAFILKNFFLRNSKEANKNQILIFKLIRESFFAINEIILNKTKHYHIKLFSEYGKKLYLANTKNQVASMVPKYFIEMSVMLFFSIGIFFVKNSHQDFDSTIPYFGVLVLAVFRSMPLINMMFVSYSGIMSKSKSIIDISSNLRGKKLNLNNVEKYSKFIRKKLIFKKSIELKNISFQYNKSRKIIDNFSIKIFKNDKIGIYGKSGVGKTTFLNLLMFLIQPDKGFIKIDNKIVRKNKLENWHNLYSYVPQNSFLYDANIIQNIIGNNDENDEKLERVLRTVELDNLFHSKKNRLKKLGEFGTKLSGGQKQRVSIARALYSDRQIIVFDEATNSLDKVLEKRIINRILNLKDKTFIMVSHDIKNFKRFNKKIII